MAVSANITTDMLSTFVRRHALLAGRTAAVEHGSYDAHLENVRRFAATGADHLLIVNFFDNLMPSFEARVHALDPELVAAQRERVCGELSSALEIPPSCWYAA